MSQSNLTSEQMFLVMFSTGQYSDRIEYPCGVTADRELAERLVTDLDRIFVEIAEPLKFRNKYAWAKYSKACDDAKPKVRALLGWKDDESVRIDDDSRAWLTEISVLK